MIYYSQAAAAYLRYLHGLNARTADAAAPTRAALALLLAGDERGAGEALHARLAEYDSDAAASGALGFIAYRRRERDAALRLLERAVQLDPGNAEHLALLAACQLGLARHAQAIAAFRAALRIDPGLHAAHTLMWSAIAGAGRLDEALLALKTALRDEPASEPAAARVRVEATTLCLIDCVNHELAVRALRRCTAGCDFDEVKWLTDRRAAVPGVQTVPIRTLRSAEDYSRFVLKELLQYVDTDYVLLAQWDGYIVNPQAWSPEFLLFDYIGARWEGAQAYDVGNGGFSLRSRALLQALQDPAIEPAHPEDAAICRSYRRYLEERHGIVFAPGALAERFSFEHIEPAALPFGFHGVTNLARFAAVPRLAALDCFFDGAAL